MLEIHGTADNSVPMASAASAMAAWRVDIADRCATEADVTSAGAVTTQTWRCADGTEVRLVQIAGAEHPWPGGRTPPPNGQHASNARPDASPSHGRSCQAMSVSTARPRSVSSTSSVDRAAAATRMRRLDPACDVANAWFMLAGVAQTDQVDPDRVEFRSPMSR